MVCTSMGPVAIELFRSFIFCPNSHNNGVHREVNVDKRLHVHTCISSILYKSSNRLSTFVEGYAMQGCIGTGLYGWIMNIVSNFLRKLTAGSDLPQSPLLASCIKFRSFIV